MPIIYGCMHLSYKLKPACKRMCKLPCPIVRPGHMTMLAIKGFPSQSCSTKYPALQTLQALALLVGSDSTPTASDSQPPPVAQLTDAAMLFAEAHQLLTCIITSTTIMGSSAFQKECCCPAAFQHMLGPAPPRRLQVGDNNDNCWFQMGQGVMTHTK